MLAHMDSPMRSPAFGLFTRPKVLLALAAATVHPSAATSALSWPSIHPQYPTNTERNGCVFGPNRGKVRDVPQTREHLARRALEGSVGEGDEAAGALLGAHGTAHAYLRVG